MTAAELNQLADATEQAILIARGLAEQARLRGLTAAHEFDYNAPLPDLNIRPTRPWETVPARP